MIKKQIMLTIKKIGIYWALFFIISSCNSADNIPLDDYFGHRDYQNKKGREKCFDEYEKILTKNPLNPYSYALLARCTDDIVKQEEIMNIGNIKCPKNSIIYTGLAIVYWRNDKLDVAYRFFEDAITIDNTNIMASANLFLLINEIALRNNSDYIERFPIFGKVEFLRQKQKEILGLIKSNPNKNRITDILDISSEEKKLQLAIASIPKKITQSEAQNFMESTCRKTNQTLMRTKTTHFNGIKLYMFLSVARNGYVCISTISENALEIVATDCGPTEIKVEQWNNL